MDHSQPQNSGTRQQKEPSDIAERGERNMTSATRHAVANSHEKGWTGTHNTD